MFEFEWFRRVIKLTKNEQKVKVWKDWLFCQAIENVRLVILHSSPLKLVIDLTKSLIRALFIAFDLLNWNNYQTFFFFIIFFVYFTVQNESEFQEFRGFIRKLKLISSDLNFSLNSWYSLQWITIQCVRGLTSPTQHLRKGGEMQRPAPNDTDVRLETIHTLMVCSLSRGLTRHQRPLW